MGGEQAQPKNWNNCSACGLRHTRDVCPRCGGQGLGDQSASGNEPSKYVGNAGDSGFNSSGDGGLMRIVIFVLIFGVGNFILYSTTGIVFIPIPRK